MTSLREPGDRSRRRASGALHRACAWVLVFLVAAPFTSPFSTCDVRGLASTAARAVTHPAVTLSTGAILVASHDTESAPVSLEEETFKDDVVLNDVDMLIEPLAEPPVSTPAQAATSVFRTRLVALRL